MSYDKSLCGGGAVLSGGKESSSGEDGGPSVRLGMASPGRSVSGNGVSSKDPPKGPGGGNRKK